MLPSNFFKVSFILLFALAFTACSNEVAPTPSEASLKAEASNTATADYGPFANTNQGLDKYWYQGLAELNVYELSQNRYRNNHPGQALLIFVSEDFLTDKQVKNDQGSNPNSAGILKTNYISRFTTGLYDYSLMTSTFTPANTKAHPRTLKITHSGQDWCGQVFEQVNYRDNGYQMQLFSYFENEGDTQEKVTADFTEEELFNRIRMLGEEMPTGDFQVIPSLTYLRLRHQPQQAFQATATLAPYEGEDFTGEQLLAYRIEYPALDRSVSIVFTATAPYRIEGWTDTYASAFDRQQRTTVAKRQKTELLPYWSLNENSAANTKLRQELGWDQ